MCERARDYGKLKGGGKMRIFDEEVYRNFQEMAELSPIVKRAADSIDNGELDERIRIAVENGMKKCSFFCRILLEG